MDFVFTHGDPSFFKLFQMKVKSMVDMFGAEYRMGVAVKSIPSTPLEAMIQDITYVLIEEIICQIRYVAYNSLPVRLIHLVFWCV